jgi:hypothetical protein
MTAGRLLVVVLALLLSGVARADEGGVAFWLSGQYASLAATPATPGFYLSVTGYVSYGTAPAEKQFTRGEAVATGLKSRLPMFTIQPTYAPTPKILGGQLSVGLGWGFGQDWTRANVSVSPSRGMEQSRIDVVLGISDLYPIVSLAWAGGDNNGMVYVTGDVPIGAYDSKRLSNVGLGHGAIDAGGGYTYLDQKKGHEASAVVGFTSNFQNTSTSYKNGVDSHLDWALSQFLSTQWNVGAVGYLYYQLTGDSGAGATLGPFKSGVASIGPEVNYALTLGGVQGLVGLRGYWEFWAQNRTHDAAGLATLVLPLGPYKSAKSSP